MPTAKEEQGSYFLQPPRCGGGCGGLLLEALIALLARLQPERGRRSLRRRLSIKLSSRASLDRKLEHGERRDGVVGEEVLRCGLNNDKSRVAEQADSTDELSPLQGDEGSI